MTSSYQLFMSRLTFEQQDKIRRYHSKICNKFNKLLSEGNVSRSEFHCAICEKQPIEFHHGNYAVWFCVIPLCKYHHKMLNRKNFDITLFNKSPEDFSNKIIPKANRIVFLREVQKDSLFEPFRSYT